MKSTTLFLLFATLAAGARGDVTSDFTTGDEGWTSAAVDPLTLQTLGMGTVTAVGGRLKAEEVSGGLFVLVAPGKFSGDRSGFYGGELSYLLADETQNTGFYYGAFLRGNGLAITYRTDAPTVAGRGYAIPLSEGGWLKNVNNVPTPVGEAEFRSVLAGLDGLAINGDWTAGGKDVVTLDDVRLARPVPEPGTLAVLGLGIAGLVRRRRRRA